MERSQMDKVLKEQNFQSSGICDTSECAIEVGKLLGVQNIIVGTLSKVGETYTVSTRLINVQTGEVLKSTTHNTSTKVDAILTEIVPIIADELSGATPLIDTTSKLQAAATALPAAPLADTTPKLQVTAPLASSLPAVFDTTALGKTHHLKSDPQASSLYRSPRKAFFYSLIIPGAGQAYVGHWGRGAAFLAVDLTLGFGWWYYAIHKSDEEMNKAHTYADKNWSSKKYESTYYSIDSALKSSKADTNVFSTLNSSRSSLCASIYGTGSSLYSYCNDISNANYGAHLDTMSKDINPSNRNFHDATTFYSLVGDQNEFVTGWSDAAAPDVIALQSYYDVLADGNPDTKPTTLYPFGTSNMQSVYNSMRSKSNDYARLQKWFLGGMLLNHLAAALDAALLAQSSNRRLYEMETRWWENVHVWGGLAWNSNTPTTQVQTWIDF